jgi:hypothetical protein
MRKVLRLGDAEYPTDFCEVLAELQGMSERELRKLASEHAFHGDCVRVSFQYLTDGLSLIVVDDVCDVLL